MVLHHLLDKVRFSALVAAVMTATLVFSGLVFQSFGREKELASADRK